MMITDTDNDGEDVTVSITLPISGLLGDYVAALGKASDEQAKLGNYTAAQSLAEGGVVLHKSSAHPTTNERKP